LRGPASATIDAGCGARVGPADSMTPLEGRRKRPWWDGREASACSPPPPPTWRRPGRPLRALSLSPRLRGLPPPDTTTPPSPLRAPSVSPCLRGFAARDAPHPLRATEPTPAATGAASVPPHPTPHHTTSPCASPAGLWIRARWAPCRRRGVGSSTRGPWARRVEGASADQGATRDDGGGRATSVPSPSMARRRARMRRCSAATKVRSCHGTSWSGALFMRLPR